MASSISNPPHHAPAAEAPLGAPRRRLGVPLPLALLLAVVAICGCAWAFVSPAFLTPDEDNHYAYVQTLVDQGRLPGGEGAQVATDQLQAIRASNVPVASFFDYGNPDWTKTGYERWQRTARQWPRTDGGGPNSASGYPPAYYLTSALPYAIASGGDTFTRLYAVRLGSALWLLVSTAAAWLLIGELFGRRRVLQLVGAASVGLWPTMTFITASVNPDAMLYAIWSLVFWRAAVIANRGLTPMRGLILGALLGLAMLVKVSGLVLVPPVALFLLWSAWRARGRPVLAAGALGAWLAAFAGPSAAWILVTRANGKAAYAQAAQIGQEGSGLNVRELASYLWQFYLPKLPFMQDVDHHFDVISSIPALNTWVGMSWGTFGWANVWFPDGVYALPWAITAIVLVALVGRLVRRARALRRMPLGPGRPALLLFLAASGGALVAGLHWTDYRFYADGLGPFAQGRYLLPGVALAAAAFVYVLDGLPRRSRALVAGAWIGLLVVMQLASLALVTARFYA